MPPDLDERVHRRLLADTDRSGDLAAKVESLALAEAPLLDGAALADVVRRVTAQARGLGVLDPLLADPDVTEVMVNGPGPVWIERHGRLERLDVVVTRETIDLLVERVVGPLRLRVDRSS